MEFNDEQDIVWYLFAKEYEDSVSLISRKTYKEFIENKDLGIHFVKNYVDIHCNFSCTSSSYIIVNAKKWLFAKLKYGI